MSVSQNFPIIAPSLSLDFANVQALDPRISFSRATTATYYGTRTALAEQNLFTYSQEFDNATGWASARLVITPNDIAAPDGTLTAEKLTQATGQTTAGAVLKNATVSTTNGLQYAYSIFAKVGVDRNFIVFDDNIVGGVVSQTWFNISTGSIGTTSANHTASIVNVGSGWYRCIVVLTAATTSTTRSVNFRVAETDNSLVVTDNQGYLYLWGAQLEQRSSVTAYTPTTTQPVTNYVPVLETAASNVARFDHTPTTFESLGLLIEEQRTNLVVYSEQFDNAAWTKTNATITANTVVAPDGTLTGDKLVEGTTNSYMFVSSVPSQVLGTQYTVSVYAKAAERSRVMILVQYAGGGNGYVIFNLSTGLVDSAGNGLTVSAGSATNAGNGFYRCTLTYTSTTTGTGVVRIDLRNENNSLTYTGNGYSGIYIWGAQLEAGAFPTSYIPTVASQVTRAADAANMTGTNFTSWYNQNEGTLYCESKTTLPTSGAVTAFLSSDISNYINTGQYTSSISRASYVLVNNAEQANLQFSALTSGTFNKFSVAFQTNNIAGTINGQTVVTDTSCLIPNVTSLTIGKLINNTQFLNGTIKKLSYYPIRLSNTNLQALTG